MANTDTQLLDKQQLSESEEAARAQEQIDFKMVTFSLGGKDYGIDIMRVKEIAKFAQFTYVPNTAPYVRGVYNLRGDIISVIDLRLMFNLPAEKRSDGAAENGLILRLETNMIGVIVDNIDKVVGISSHQVQPPHPIFGDINVKYISGVAEHEGRLYIVLDVDRIFSREAEDEEGHPASTADAAAVAMKPSAPAEPQPEDGHPEKAPSTPSPAGLQKEFVSQGLSTFAGFHVTPANEDWFNRRLDSWTQERGRSGEDAQLQDEAEARSFLGPFYSRHTASFWQSAYIDELRTLLPAMTASVINVWNPGCGSGHESYSIALMLKEAFPQQQVKVWAGDKDLMKISTAPNLVFSRSEVPDRWQEYVVEGKNGPTFDSSVKDSIHFEFSDVLNAAGMPKMDMVVSRDLLSFHTASEQGKILRVFEEALKPGGTLLLGDNERTLDADGWEEKTGDSLTVYRRR